MAEPIPQCLRRTYEIVAGMPNRAVDGALAGMLASLNESLSTLAVTKLIERGNLPGLITLVSGYNGYDDHLKALVREHIVALHEAARRAIASDAVDTRLSTIELIRASRNCPLAYLLSEALTRRCSRTAMAAATALKTLALSVIDRRAAGGDAAQQRGLCGETQHLGEALRAGLDSWQTHHRIEVLEASMLLADVMEAALFKKVSQPRSPLASAVGNLLRADNSPAMAAFSLRALGVPELRAFAVERISAAEDPAFIERLVDEMWVTVDPAAENGCASIRTMVWLENGAPAQPDLSGPRGAKAVRLVRASGMPLDRKLGAYRKWINGACDALGRAALWQLTAMDTPEATRALEAVAASGSREAAQIAAQELFRRKPAAGLPASRGVGETRSEDDSEVAAYWERFDELDHDRRVRIGRRLRKKYESSFEQRLRNALRNVEFVHRERAMRMIRDLRLGHEMPERVFALTRDSDERIRSLAVAMLSEIEGPAAVRILRRALEDTDPRVQANAIEVIRDQDVHRWTRELGDRLRGKHNRVRANAIKTLLRHRERDAAVALLSMLSDASAAHRISALWVAEQLELASLLPRVRRMAISDPDARVRDRADEVLRCEQFAGVGFGDMSDPREVES